MNATPPRSAATGTIKDDEPASLVLSGDGTGTDNTPVQTTATVRNTSGDALPGVTVRFELFRDIGTPDDVWQAIDLGG